jgi:hypothetical protein
MTAMLILETGRKTKDLNPSLLRYIVFLEDFEAKIKRRI